MEYFKNKYSEVELIKKDNWANIYAAINNETNEKVQLKILKNQNDNTKYINLITCEINQLQDLKHKNLIGISGIYKFIENDTTYHYIETEYFKGKTLSDKMILTGHTCKESLEIIKQVAEGLNEFHYRGLNYETLSAENIFINSEGVVKIDVLSYVQQKYDEVEEYETYEEYDDEFDYEIDEDIYAVGVILYQLITRDRDFKLRKLKKNIEDEELYSILYSLTSKKIKYRYGNLNEFLSDINEHLQYLSSDESQDLEYINESKSEIEDDFDEYDEEYDYESNKSVLIKRLCACLAVILVFVGGIKVVGLVKKDNSKTETPIEMVTEEESTDEETEEEQLDEQQVESTDDTTINNTTANTNSNNSIDKENTTTNNSNNSTTTTQKPSDSTTTQEPSDSTTTQKPSDSTTTQKPSDSTTTQEPSDSTTTQEPSDSTTTQEPSDSTTTQEPSDSTTMQEPSDSTTMQEPSDSTI